MAFDFKKEYKAFCMPPKSPVIIDVPPMNYLAVRGHGDPNEQGGPYQSAVGLLYGVAYTLKMSYKGPYQIDGFFDYVVPPLEGLWWQEGICDMDYARKDLFRWLSLIRLPDFVKQCDFEWAVAQATLKKKMDYSGMTFFTYHEGPCVQCMHVGAYDDEPATVAAMDAFANENGYAIDIGPDRHHHEIYLTDPRKGDAAKQKTVIRHPIKQQSL